LIPAILALEDGSFFRGSSIGAHGIAVGETVFNTAMTGYQEILTDPSYAQQIITLTYPHIGNTGTNDDDFESEKVWAQGLVIRDSPLRVSSWRAQYSLPEFLKRWGVVAIADIDTRRLTRLIREKGALSGCIVAGHYIHENEAINSARAFPGLAGMDLAKIVSRNDRITWLEGSWNLGTGYRSKEAQAFNVVAYDFGIKRNILRLLTDRGCTVTVVPAMTQASEVLAMHPDGVFLSNGPGDPDPCDYAIGAIREFLDAAVPIFGICLGHQLLALASGARTLKMPHGHHGANHPVKDLTTDRMIITSQNHGFAVDENSLPDHLSPTHISLFDGSLQGICRTDKPAFGFQGHPEASPGPQDCAYLFDAFVDLMRENGA
jgi:carbamoyl-phosphate synthase small subunit